jgi:catechol 2,3-dioxygenase-like lactoylglutathione lyase family enzyme
VNERVSLITLSVSDFKRSKLFYEALGWSVALDIDETAFFQANGIVFGFGLGPDGSLVLPK